MFASFMLAVQFLTRLPIKNNISFSERGIGQSVIFYPLIGFLIGAALALLNALLPPQSYALNSALILSAWVLLTGGLHLDGLADCSDAWAGGLASRERSLAIMKDPAAGPIAVIILVLIMLLKWSALFSLMQHQSLTFALLLAPFAGRLSILILMLSTPYIREHGLGAVMQQQLPRFTTKFTVCVCLLLLFWLSNIITLLAVLSLVAILRSMAMHRLQGLTGDIYGASVEIVETTVLISLVLTNG